MRNNFVVIKSNALKNKDDPYLSSLFHLYEMGLFLWDNGFNVLYWVDDTTLEPYLDWDFRYMQQLPIIYNDDMITKNYILLTDTFPNNLKNIQNIKKIFILNNYDLSRSFTYCDIFETINDKCYILYDKRLNEAFLNTDDGYTFFENNLCFEYESGLYTKFTINTHTKENLWFSYIYNNTEIQNTLDMYIEKYKVKTTNKLYINAYNKCSGLLYGMNKDYFNRLPFEFSYNKKNIVMFDSDPSFRNMTTHQLWNHSYIIEDIPMLNLDLNLFKNS